MTLISNSLVRADREHLIHSAVSWSEHERVGPTILTSAEGVFVTDSEGRTLLDGFSGLWCVNLGYSQQSIVAAAAEQMARLPYATGYFHYGCEASIHLAEELATRAPGDLNHVFFTLGGSDAVDAAVRFIRYFHSVTGRPEKRHMIALDRAYHGSSSIGAGLTGLPSFHAHFGAPLETQHHISMPYIYRSEHSSDSEVIAASVAEFKAKVEDLGKDNVAAFFVEPIIGSGGIIPPPFGWLKAMREATSELGILLVADEVITGFGRTGPMFGVEYENVVPDVMTLAKGLTSGYVPMGAVLLSDIVYRGIADNSPQGSIIGHGLTYSGHPVSAAVAREVLRIYDEQKILNHADGLGDLFAQQLDDLAGHPLVGEVRYRGLLGALELVADKRERKPFASESGIAENAARLGRENGLIFRAFADGTIGLAPPLTCSAEEIGILFERLERTLNQLLAVAEGLPKGSQTSRREALRL